jgi:predicted RNA-binding protein with PUA-like domain
MHTGDMVLIYHSGEQRAVVGSGSIPREPYPDPEASDPKATVVDVAVAGRARTPVTLGMIKSDPLFGESPLVKQPRLSVVPLTEEQWNRLVSLSAIDQA